MGQLVMQQLQAQLPLLPLAQKKEAQEKLKQASQWAYARQDEHMRAATAACSMQCCWPALCRVPQILSSQ